MSVAQIQALTALVVAIGSALGAALAIYHALTAKKTANTALQQSSPGGQSSPPPRSPQ